MKITRIQLVRSAGGWRSYRIQFWRGTSGKMREYPYSWQRMALILACLKWDAWVGAISIMCDTYNRVERID